MKNNITEKNIFINDKILFIYDKYENIGCKWSVSNLKNKLHSSRGQTDRYGDIWVASNAWKASDDGIQKYVRGTWTTYFKGSTFYTLCFDLNGNLYASTLPDFDEPGVIMRYNYSVWDTVIICSGKAKWVPCMHFDNENNLWFGVLSRSNVAPESGDGLYKYSGINIKSKKMSYQNLLRMDTTQNNNNNDIENYTIYNSELPSNSVVDIAIDGKNNKWIAMYSGGVAKLDADGSWKIFNTENSPLTNTSVEHIVVDDSSHVWFTVYASGLVKLKE